MTKNFEILFDDIIYEPLKYRLEITSRLNNLFYSLQKDFGNNQKYCKLSIKEINYRKICSFGSGLCFSIFHWNDNIEKKIIERSTINNFTGNFFFSGTEEEKKEINEKDRKKIIKFPENYINDFVENIKTLNGLSNESKIIDLKKEFEIDLNYPDSIWASVSDYNLLYNTDFFISEVKLIDQLYFAKIEVKKASLLDIFCLGYKIHLNDEFRMTYSK